MNSIENSIRNKIQEKGVPLEKWHIQINYGVKTGLNDAFIISGKTKEQIIADDPKSAEIIRPILRGRDIKKYYFSFADLWLIALFPSRHYDIEDYPAIKRHLLSFGIERLEQTGNVVSINGEIVRARKKTTNKWYETQDSISYWDDFSKQKIIYPETTQGAYFIVDNGEFYIDKTCFCMIAENPFYLIATLSSQLFEFAYKHLFSSIELGTNGYQYNKHALVLLPIITPETIDNDIFNKMQSLAKEAMYSTSLQKKENAIQNIDQIIYKLYDISENEIDYIKNSL